MRSVQLDQRRQTGGWQRQGLQLVVRNVQDLGATAGVRGRGCGVVVTMTMTKAGNDSSRLPNKHIHPTAAGKTVKCTRVTPQRHVYITHSCPSEDREGRPGAREDAIKTTRTIRAGKAGSAARCTSALRSRRSSASAGRRDRAAGSERRPLSAACSSVSEVHAVRLYGGIG